MPVYYYVWFVGKKEKRKAQFTACTQTQTHTNQPIIAFKSEPQTLSPSQYENETKRKMYKLYMTKYLFRFWKTS